MTLIVEPEFGFSGTILNIDSVNMLSPVFSELWIGSRFLTPGKSFAMDVPVDICVSFLSSAFQLIPGFGLSVFTPNFTDSPGLMVSDDVKIITPCAFFSPTHPFSVLKDLKLKSLPSQILKVLTSSAESFVNSNTVVSSNAMPVTEIPSP